MRTLALETTTGRGILLGIARALDGGLTFRRGGTMGGMDQRAVGWSLVIVAMTGLACGSSSGTGDAAVVAPQVGTVVDEMQAVLGDELKVVTLAPLQGRMEIEFPANATAPRTAVTVRAERGIPVREGLNPAADLVLHVATQGLRFNLPALLRQKLPPAPTGGTYVAVFSPSAGDRWTTGSAAKLGRFGAVIDAGPGDPTSSVWEIEVTGSGLWGIGLIQPAGPLDAATSDTAPQTDVPAPPPADASPDAGVDAPIQADGPRIAPLDAPTVVDSFTASDRGAEAMPASEAGVPANPDVAPVEPPMGVDAGAPVAVDSSGTGVPADRNALLGTWTIVSSVCNGTAKTGVGGTTLTVAGDTGYFTTNIAGGCVQTVPTTNSYPALGRMNWTTGDPICTGTSCPSQACSPLGTIPHSAAATISGSTLTLTEELTPPEEYACPSGTQVTTLTR